MAEEAMIVDLEEEQSKVEQLDPAIEAEELRKEANHLYFMKQYKQALTKYSKIIELCPKVDTYYGNRAACYMMLYQYRNAMADAKKCVELNPNVPKAYTRVIRCALVLGEIVEAEAYINKRKLLDPKLEPLSSESKDLENVKTSLMKAEAALRAEDYRMVVYCMDCCCAVSTSCPRFKLTKAECLVMLGRYQEAQEIANDVLLQDRTNADATYVRGMCLYYQDNIQLAVTHFQETLRLAPDHTKALAIYKKAKSLQQKKTDGTAKFKQGCYQEAYNFYSEALAVDPTNKMANTKLHFNKATVAAKLGKLNESISECTEALKLDENYLKALLRRATCFMDLHNYEEAVRDYERACKMDKSRDNRRLLHEAKEALRKSKRKDYYKILGIGKTASIDDIKRAYKKRALVHHPDRHASASDSAKKEEEKKFKEVGEAYSILSDPKKRTCYDEGQSFDGVNPTAPDYDTFEAFFNGSGRARGGFPFTTNSYFQNFPF